MFVYVPESLPLPCDSSLTSALEMKRTSTPERSGACQLVFEGFERILRLHRGCRTRTLHHRKGSMGTDKLAILWIARWHVALFARDPSTRTCRSLPGISTIVLFVLHVSTRSSRIYRLPYALPNTPSSPKHHAERSKTHLNQQESQDPTTSS